MRDSNKDLVFAVDRARLQFVLRGQPVSLISTFLLALITMYVMWPGVSHSILLGWLSVFTLVTLGRAAVWQLTRTSAFPKKPIAFWRKLFILGCGLSGLSWGIASVLFTTSSSLLETYMAVIIAGTAAGSITSLASDRWAAYALVLPCVLPFAIKQVSTGNSVDLAIGIVTLLFLATIGGSVSRFHNQLAIMMTARAELQESEAAVSKLNDRMNLAANVAKVGVYEWDLITQEVNWDAQVYELWDLDPNDGPATLEAWRSRVHPADLGPTQARFAEIIKNENEFDVELRVVARNGIVRDVRNRGSIQRDRKGEPIKMIGLVMDVSELRRLDRMKQEFVSVVSHELRTPLTSIRGALGLLSSAAGTLSLPKSQQLLDLANRNAERLNHLIDDILDIDKIESGKMRFELVNRDLNELLSQAVLSIAPYADRFGVGVRLRPLSTSTTVCVDASRLLQVLTNLLSNAAKFSPAGDVVDVYAEIKDQVVRVSVKDGGPGIPSEFQPKIFGKFSQVDSSDSRNKGGSGLGLAISKAIIEVMEGSIGFSTRPGKGTVFYFELPIVGSAPQPDGRHSKLAAFDLMATDPNLKLPSKSNH